MYFMLVGVLGGPGLHDITAQVEIVAASLSDHRSPASADIPGRVQISISLDDYVGTNSALKSL